MQSRSAPGWNRRLKTIWCHPQFPFLQLQSNSCGSLVPDKVSSYFPFSIVSSAFTPPPSPPPNGFSFHLLLLVSFGHVSRPDFLRAVCARPRARLPLCERENLWVFERKRPSVTKNKVMSEVTPVRSSVLGSLRCCWWNKPALWSDISTGDTLFLSLLSSYSFLLC